MSVKPDGTVPPIRVVDTNVLVLANLVAAGSCSSRCARALNEIKDKGRLAIDRSGRILKEYRQNCSGKGEPGLGTAFVRWAHDHLGRADRVHMVEITAGPENTGSFAEFPADEKLAKFDPSDKKFIAVANAHPEKPPILQASDSKWWGFRAALQQNGITVEFLCPDEIAAAYDRKVGGR